MNPRRALAGATVGLLVGSLVTSCARATATKGQCRSTSVTIGSATVPPSSLPEGLSSALASFLLTQSQNVTVQRFDMNQQTAFLLFSFKEGARQNHGFGSFSKEDGQWTADQVATDLWPVLPAACSGDRALLSLQTSGAAYTGGYVDPTISRLDIVVANQVVGHDRPLEGGVLLSAPAGARLLAYRGGDLVWKAEVKNIQRYP
jgi:hypothetical protein